jgi:lysine-specific demethylase 3
MRKRRPIEIIPQPTNAPPPAQLSRVSEPSPLIASAATTITTVENLAVSGSVIQRPSPQPVPCPTVPAAPATATKPPSPPPKQTPTYQGHKLKKAWLQRHSGEDVTEQRCITPVTPSPSPAPSSPANSNPVPSSPPTPSTTPTKGKVVTTKTVNMVRKATASVVLPINGHADSPVGADSDSSSSDEKAAPAQRKSPAKRKPKVKRRKGPKKTSISEDKRRKVTQSESPSESDKESGTEKDSEDSVCSTGAKKTASGKESTGNNGTGSTTTNNQPQGNGGKKRGRRPKSKNDEPRPPKKSRGGNDGDGSPTPPPRDPIKKPPISQLKKTGESFLQDGYCFEVAPKLAKCRECRLTQNQRNKNMLNNIFCRFYYFRRLRYTKNGQLATAGFSDPYTDASEVSAKSWSFCLVTQYRRVHQKCK